MINSRNSFYFVLGLILIAAFSRIIPHYPNFTPLCAILYLEQNILEIGISISYSYSSIVV